MFQKTTEIPADVEIQRQLTAVHIENWQNSVFSWHWWLLLTALLLLIFIWWKLALSDKKRFPEVLTFAMIATVVTMGVVEYGEELCLWVYPTDILPVFPPLTSVGLTFLPVSQSLCYQYFRTWKSFTAAAFVSALIYSFIIEPLLVAGGLLIWLRWEYYYSVPTFIIPALGVRAVLKLVVEITERARMAR